MGSVGQVCLLLQSSFRGQQQRQQQTHMSCKACCWHLHFDAAHMGLGGDDSWSPSVHDKYLLPLGKYQLGVVMRAVGGGEGGGKLFAAAQQLQASATAIAGVV